MSGVLGFPSPVNEKAARTVAGGVLLLGIATVVLSVTVDTFWLWLTVPLAYGFLARVLTGPKLSPLGQLATRVIAPRLGEAKPTAGPPKRFAQGMGFAFTASAAVLHFALAWDRAAIVLLIGLIGAATLESVLGFCIGCRIFGLLMKAGVIPESVCAECADIWIRVKEPTAAA